MSHILVTADFPGITSAQRKEIYECLEKKHWKKVIEFSRDISTVWYASFTTNTTEEGAIRTTINEFKECSTPYCQPKLVILWGPHSPTFYGLT